MQANDSFPKPITSAERIQEVDVLRGFALFGILLVNMTFFSWPSQITVTQSHEWNTLLDKLAFSFITLFGESKFFSLFSFLFGFGLFILMERVEARGGRFVPLYSRRLFVLLIMGLVHVLCFWVGDILVPYAILGFLLLLFRKRSPKTLLISAVTILVLFALFSVGLLGLTTLVGMQPGGEAALAESFATSEAAYAKAAQETIQVYQSGKLGEIMAQHWADFKFISVMTLYIVPNIFAMFLMGLYAGRCGILQNISDHLSLIRRVRLLGLGLGLTGELCVVILSGMSDIMVPTPLGTLRAVVHAFSAPLLSFGYMSTIVLLMQKEPWRKRLTPLSNVGRMALTNYLLQTLVCTTIFYSYGLGLYGQVGPALGLLLTVIIYSLQIPFSMWWLARFRFGPMEWLWRSLTYLKWQPMHLKTK